MGKKPGLSLARHQELGLGLSVLQNGLCNLSCEISNAYRKSSKAATLSAKLEQALSSLRCELDGLAVSENREVVVEQNLRIYYPPQEEREPAKWLWAPRDNRGGE